jgi:hypothetical protein
MKSLQYDTIDATLDALPVVLMTRRATIGSSATSADSSEEAIDTVIRVSARFMAAIDVPTVHQTA